MCFILFFFSSRRRHTRLQGDWSSDVCSSDLLFGGALFWAKEQDPFVRKWFTLKTVDHDFVKCVAVLPKPIRPHPVVIYAHGPGGTLMNDGNDLRKMAELGLGKVSFE